MIGYRVRLRVHLAKAFSTSDTVSTLRIGDREVSVRSQKRDQPLSETRWIALSAGGFSSEEEAGRFGERLRALTLFAGLCCRLGVDAGSDRASGFVTEEFARSTGLLAADERIVPNVHGLSILVDDEKNKIPIIEMEGTVRGSFSRFAETMVELDVSVHPELRRSATGVRVLNLAIASSDPLSRIVLALSAVEELGQGETWSQSQRRMLDDLAAQIESTDLGETQEARRELAEGIRRMQRLSLRQGVIRVLRQLDLMELRKEWDRIYALRSGIFHGTAHLDQSETSRLADDAVAICGRIVLGAAKREGATIPSICASNFPGSLARAENATRPEACQASDEGGAGILDQP